MHGALRSIDQDEVHRDSAATLRTLNAFAVDLIAIPNTEDLFWYVAQNVVGSLNFVDCVIYQADAAQTMLTQVAAWGEKNPYDRTILNPLRIPFGEGITGQSAQTRRPIVVEDLLQDQNYIPDTQPARSEICVPLISNGRVVGVIDSEDPQVGAFGSAELEVLITVAAMTGAKLELLAEAERSIQRYHDLVQSHAELTREISSRKALEAELLNARKLEAVGRLTGGFAHSFNNLLTVISGNLELIDAETDSQAIHDSVGEARTAADRGAKLIRDMLAFSQKMHLEPRRTDLNQLVERSRERSGHDPAKEIVLVLEPDLWPVDIDPTAAEIALVNLILNAREATLEGGGLRITTENICYGIDATADPALKLLPGRYVRLCVTDDGVGIPPAALPRIYDPFYTTKPVGGGTGLGLSMVKGFMQQSKGAVAARNAVPQGTTFELYFPIAVDDMHT